MLDRRRKGSTAAVWLALAWLGPLAGCATVENLLNGGAGDEPAAAEDDVRRLDAGDLAVYLEPMQALIEGDPVTQAEVYHDAAEAARFVPTTTNRLRHALLLAMPGHPAASPAEAYELLSGLMAAGDSLLPEERTLVAIHLKEVEQRLILDTEARRLQEAAEAARAAQNAEAEQQLQAALEENRRLRIALDEAQQKLEAITSIERSIRERDNGAGSP